jgi:hypothetical protein
MRFLLATLLATALALPATAAAGTSPYSGHIGLVSRPGEKVRSGEQGAGWQAIFRERRSGRVAYRLCLRQRDNGTRRCWNRRSSRTGRSRVFVALFVNDRGGPGRWRATWSVDGSVVAIWGFRVEPE